jgi:hypothetical protein
MTRVEDALRAALDDAPMPQPTAPDPVGRLATRYRRARRRRAVGTGIAALAVVAAVAVPVALLTGAKTKPAPVIHPPKTPPPTQTWRVHDLVSEGVAYADGSVWVSGSGTSSHPRWYVDRLDATDGHELAHIEVPGPISFVTAGLGKVWVYGGGDGGYPQSSIAVVDPTTDAVVASTTIPPGQGGPDKPAFADGSAWFVLGDTSRIGRATVQTRGGKVGLTFRSFPFAAHYAGNPGIAATGAGALWLGPVHGTVVRIVPRAGSGRLGRSFTWPGKILATAGPSSVWTTEGASPRSRVSALQPALLAEGDSLAYNPRLSQNMPAFEVVGDLHGLWLGGNTSLAFFGHDAMLSDGRPTAVLRTRDQILTLAAVRNQVYYTTDLEEAVYVWSPAAAQP